MGRKKKTIEEGFLKGMEDALNHAQNVPHQELKTSLSQEESSNDAMFADIDQEKSPLKNEADEFREEDQEHDLKQVEEISDTELQKELKRFLIPKLRSASYRWKFRSDAIKRARKERGIYECAMCQGRFKNGEFIVDHIEPVVPLDGWDGLNWTQYVTRMFCATDGFQILCKPCSTVKTDMEVQIRKIRREAKKKQK